MAERRNVSSPPKQGLMSPQDTSFGSYRSSSGRESGSENEDGVDRSLRHSFNDRVNESNDSQTSPRRTRRSTKQQEDQTVDPRRSIHRSPARSPTSVNSPDKQTPPRSSPYTSGFSSGSPQTDGSPSPYKDLLKQMEQVKAEFESKSPGTRSARQRPQSARPSSRGSRFSPSPSKLTPTQPLQPSTIQCKDSTMIFFAIVGIVVVVVMGFGYNFLTSVAKQPVEETPMMRFESRLAEIKAKFPAQQERFWQVLGAATKRVIKDERPIQPGVIMIGSTPETRKEADCIAQYFGEVVKETFQVRSPVNIDVVNDYGTMSPEDAKVALERSLRDGFGDGAKSAVISNLQDMHGNTAMLLHAFCDNDNAPFTKVIILFTLHTNQPTLQMKDDKKIEDFLTKMWQPHLNYDDIYALLSRVANNIAIVTKETKDVKNKYC